MRKSPPFFMAGVAGVARAAVGNPPSAQAAAAPSPSDVARAKNSRRFIRPADRSRARAGRAGCNGAGRLNLCISYAFGGSGKCRVRSLQFAPWPRSTKTGYKGWGPCRGQGVVLGFAAQGGRGHPGMMLDEARKIGGAAKPKQCGDVLER